MGNPLEDNVHPLGDNVKDSWRSCYLWGMKNGDFGDWLSDQIYQSGLTQKDFATAIGFSDTAVSAWVGGKRRVSVHAIRAIADYLGMDAQEVARLAGRDLGGRADVPDGQSTKGPLTTKADPWEYLDQRLKRIELRLGENLPTVEVIGRVPADGVRWADIGDVYTVEVLREFVADASAPFGLEVTGDCFRSVGIYPGDIVVCDQPQGRTPNDRQIVVVRVEDGVTLKRWCVVDGGIELRDGDDQVVYTLSEGDDFEVQGLFLTFIPRAPR